MENITLRVLDGADRGHVYADLDPPVTIGREEGNSIQLNDERVSRYHVKIQNDHERVVLTDLESTNGTKVNGEDIQLRILRFGDLISLGRSVLIFGTREQIAERLEKLNADADPPASKPDDSADFELDWNADGDYQATLHTIEPPEIPDRLSPGQAAQLSEMLEYVHIRIRHILGSVQCEGQAEVVPVGQREWQNLLDLQSRIAEYLRSIGDPETPE